MEIAVLTDIGQIRSINQDSFGIFAKAPICDKKGKIFIVADGMGGHAAGDLASKMAVEHIIERYYLLDGNNSIDKNLEISIKQSNKYIFEKASTDASRKGMGSTITAIVLRGDKGIIANVGDSRTYLIRGGKITQITFDHSWVAEQIRNGVLTVEQARNHPNRNVITRALGIAEETEVDLFNLDLRKNDIIVLCSDGLYSSVDDEEIRHIALGNSTQLTCRKLVDLANKRGGKDNITVMILKIIKKSKILTQEDTLKINPDTNLFGKHSFNLKKTKMLFIGLIIGIATVFVVLSLWFLFKTKTNGRIKIQRNFQKGHIISKPNKSTLRNKDH